MMRANAPIPALLALAALYLSPVDSLAKPSHRHAPRTVHAAATKKHAAETPRTTAKSTSSSTGGHRQKALAHHQTHRILNSRTAPVSAVLTIAQKPQPSSVEEAATTPVILPSLYNKRGRLIVPPPLKGSHEILVHQNLVADRDGLDRIQDDDDLLDMRTQTASSSLSPQATRCEIDDRLPVEPPLLPSLDRAVPHHDGPRVLRPLPHPATGQLRRPNR